MPKNHKGEANVRRCTPGPCVIAVVALATALIFAPSRLSGATTVNANSASQFDVAAAIASAADGDTVTIPGGTASWSRTLIVRKAITLQGAGVGVTIIKDSVQKGRLIDWTLAAGYPSRLTGIEFQGGSRINTALAPGGILNVKGSNTNGSRFRWDHCKWKDMNGFPVFNTVIGVADHNEYWATATGQPAKEFMHYFYNDNWDGQNPGNGDYSWSDPTNYGTDQCFVIEDCLFNNTSGSANKGATDGYNGARFVVRHCTLNNATINNHGTEARRRGGRSIEAYRNTHNTTAGLTEVGEIRSGTCVVHDNTINLSNAHWDIKNYRNFWPFRPWGGADGTNLWDINDTTGGPNHDGIYFTGTATANNSGVTVRVSGNPNWTTNQWAGYTVRRLTNLCNFTGPTFGWINSNTSDTITYNIGYTSNLQICAGDSLQFRKVIHTMDAPGRVRGSTIMGGTDQSPSRLPPGWNDQVTEPVYCWNNGSMALNFGPGTRQGINGFNNTPMPGYTELVYPHPLTKGLPPPEQTTRNATANSQHDAHTKRLPWGGKKPGRKKAKKPKESQTNETADGQENLGN
jgi:hypothetical protein